MPEDSKSYRPTSLLCHIFKLFKRLLLNRLTPILEPNFIAEVTGFRPGKSCTNQTVKLTQFIEDGLEKKNVTSAVFVDLSAAYDTVNIKRLLLNVGDLIKDFGFVRLLSVILNNRRFQMHCLTFRCLTRKKAGGDPKRMGPRERLGFGTFQYLRKRPAKHSTNSAVPQRRWPGTSSSN